jgi:hypothetical protein
VQDRQSNGGRPAPASARASPGQSTMAGGKRCVGRTAVLTTVLAGPARVHWSCCVDDTRFDNDRPPREASGRTAPHAPRLFPMDHPNRKTRRVAGMVGAAAVTAQFVAAKATRDALFLANAEVTGAASDGGDHGRRLDRPRGGSAPGAAPPSPGLLVPGAFAVSGLMLLCRGCWSGAFPCRWRLRSTCRSRVWVRSTGGILADGVRTLRPSLRPPSLQPDCRRRTLPASGVHWSPSAWGAVRGVQRDCCRCWPAEPVLASGRAPLRARYRSYGRISCHAIERRPNSTCNHRARVCGR